MNQITILKSKLHKAHITETELEYEGSITIDRELMNKVNILPYEKVHVFNLNNGNRFVTYVIEGESGSREICVNGAAAHLAEKGDRVIIISFLEMDEKSARNWKPAIVTLDQNNNPKK